LILREEVRTVLNLLVSISIIVPDVSQSESEILQSKEEDRIEDLR
jgi:hypothetical protein